MSLHFYGVLYVLNPLYAGFYASLNLRLTSLSSFYEVTGHFSFHVSYLVHLLCLVLIANTNTSSWSEVSSHQWVAESSSPQTVSAEPISTTGTISPRQQNHRIIN